jgi:hypothetical protein
LVNQTRSHSTHNAQLTLFATVHTLSERRGLFQNILTRNTHPARIDLFQYGLYFGEP